MSFYSASTPGRFGLPGGWYGTSMATPHVSAAAAMVIASGVIGRNPSPAAILTRLEQTAQPLGGAVPNPDYGYGLLDVGAATTPGSPPTPPTPPTPTTPTTPTTPAPTTPSTTASPSTTATSSATATQSTATAQRTAASQSVAPRPGG
jgi:hypothetical protein